MNNALPALFFGYLLITGVSPNVTKTTVDKDVIEFARVLAILGSLDPRDHDFYLHLSVGPCGSPCIVDKNLGGKVWLFQDAARNIKQDKRNLLVINGECASACAILADQARPQACITEKAHFEFHQKFIDFSRRGKKVRKYLGPQPQSKDVDRWVRHNGGYPRKKLTVMPLVQAKKFWPVCDLHPPLPKNDPRKVLEATAE